MLKKIKKIFYQERVKNNSRKMQFFMINVFIAVFQNKIKSL